MNAGIIDNNRFGPYGEAISPVAKNSRLTNSPWGYTGESYDIEGGLIYLRARYYEPNTGRFIQQDSYPYFGVTKNPLTRNLYIYGNENPLMYTDPSGHDALLWSWIPFIDGPLPIGDIIYGVIITVEVIVTVHVVSETSKTISNNNYKNKQKINAQSQQKSNNAASGSLSPNNNKDKKSGSFKKKTASKIENKYGLKKNQYHK